MDSHWTLQQQAPAEKDVLQYNDEMSLEDLILFQRYGITGYTKSEKNP